MYENQKESSYINQNNFVSFRAVVALFSLLLQSVLIDYEYIVANYVGALTMKVRAKYQGVSRPVEVENDQCTLTQLHHETAEVFHLDER
jgi:hypothetical protein